MKSFWNNYKSSIVLLGAILLGGIVGATMGEKAVVLTYRRIILKLIIHDISTISIFQCYICNS